MRKWGLGLLALMWAQGPPEQPVPFTQADKERLIRIEVTLEQFMKATDKRFEMLETTLQTHIQTTNARFESVEKRLERLEEGQNLLLTLLLSLIGVFVAAFVGLFAYLIWDRRTHSRPLQARMKVQESRIDRLLKALRELAQSDERIAQLLKKHHLL